jgi:hypothetical protein
MTDTTRGARLNGWRLWHGFCLECSYTAEALSRNRNPVMVLCSFVLAMDEQGVKEYRIKDAVTAVRNVFEFIRPDLIDSMAKSAVLRTFLAGITAGIKHMARYKHIWDLRVMLDHIREGPPSTKLSGRRLLARLAAIMMMLVPCRPIGMLRMQVGEERWAADGSYVEVPTQDKMCRGRGALLLLLRKLEEANLCPLTVYRLVKERAASLGVFDTVWCSDNGKRFSNSSSITRLLRELMTEMDISEEYTGYTFRHALITFLIGCGLSEVEVNAFTGHSNNSHTAFTNYFRLDQKWVGAKLAAGTLRPVSALAARMICADNAANQEDECAVNGEVQDMGTEDIPSFLASPTAFALAQGRSMLAPRPPRPPLAVASLSSSSSSSSSSSRSCSPSFSPSSFALHNPFLPSHSGSVSALRRSSFAFEPGGLDDR